MPFVKPNTRIIPPAATRTLSSKKKKSSPESKYVGKPLVYGAEAIKSLRITKESDKGTVKLPRLVPQKTKNEQQNPANVLMNEIMGARQVEMMTNFVSQQPLSSHSINESSWGKFSPGVKLPRLVEREISAREDKLSRFGQRQATQKTTVKLPRLVNRAPPPTSRNTFKSSSFKRSGFKSAATTFKKNPKYNFEPEPEEDFESFKRRVLDRTTEKLGLNPSIQDAMLKFSLGKSLFKSKTILGAGAGKGGSNKAGPSKRVQFSKSKGKGQSTSNDGNELSDDDIDDFDDIGINQADFEYLQESAKQSKPYEVTFGGREDPNRDLEFDQEDFMTNFRQRSSNLKKFLKKKTKEFDSNRKQMKNDRTQGKESKYTVPMSLIRNPLLPFGFEKEYEREQRKKNQNNKSLPTNQNKDFPLNFQDFLSAAKPKLHSSEDPRSDDINADNHTDKIVKHARKLLEGEIKSLKFQPDDSFAKKLELGRTLVTKHHQPTTSFASRAGGRHLLYRKETEEQKDQSEQEDHDLDEFQYKPLKGIGKYGPIKLLEVLKAKRDEVRKNGYQYEDGEENDDDADSLGTGWAEVLKMHSSILDETLDTPGPSSLAFTPVSSTELRNKSNKGSDKKKEKDAKDVTASLTKGVKAGEKVPNDDKTFTFEEGKDYYFNNAHPAFMKAVDNLDDDEVFRKNLPQFDSPQQFEIKAAKQKPSSMADVIYKPKHKEFLPNIVESRTPSGLMDLDARKTKNKFGRNQRAAGVTNAYEKFIDPTAKKPSYWTSRDDRRLLKEAKNDQIRAFLQQQEDEIQLFNETN